MTAEKHKDPMWDGLCFGKDVPQLCASSSGLEWPPGSANR